MHQPGCVNIKACMFFELKVLKSIIKHGQNDSKSALRLQKIVRRINQQQVEQG